MAEQLATRKIGDIVGLGALAGIAGGLAEIVWIAFYQNVAGGSAADVAAAVTTTVAPSLSGWSGAVAFGLVVHMALALGLGVLVAAVLRRVAPGIAGTMREAAIVVGVLALVWAMNFMVILPMLNPAFVHIVPLPISLASKLLFGLAAAQILYRTR